MTPKRRRRVAFHEAGHAVIWWLDGEAIDGITIKPTGEYLGAFHWRRPDDDEEETIREYGPGELGPGKFIKGALAKKRARTSVAGEIADHILMNTKHIRLRGSDARILTNSMCFRDDDTGKARERLMALEVRDDLRGKWKVVEALAEALLEKETLDGDEATRVIKEADQKHYPSAFPEDDEEWNSEPMPVDAENAPF